MKVLFLYPNKREESLIPPSITLLSRILKNEGHEVELFDTTSYEIDLDRIDGDRSVVVADQVRMNRMTVLPTKAIYRESKGDVVKGFLTAVSSFGPDLIAVTSTESTFLLAIALLRELRNAEGKQIPTLLGGIFATKAPWLALRYPEIDMCAVGEGEWVFPNLCLAMEEGRPLAGLPGIHVKNGENIVHGPPASLVDINKNPNDLDIGLFDEHRLYRPMCGKQWRMLSVTSHIGCPYPCHFCNSPGQNEKFGAGFFRTKTPENIKAEILHYIENWGINFVFFWADTFLAWSSNEFEAFCEMYSDIKLPFWCQTRVETITEKNMRALKDVGLYHISFGLEHGNEQFRRTHTGRNYTNADFIRRLEIVAAFGQTFTVNNIIGFPDETRELVFDTIRLNRDIPPALTRSCSICMPYQGTATHRYAVSRGYVPEDSICPANNDDAVMHMSSMSQQEIVGLANNFSFYVHFPEWRWPEIRLAEKSTKEGKETLAKLRAEYLEEKEIKHTESIISNV